MKGSLARRIVSYWPTAVALACGCSASAPLPSSPLPTPPIAAEAAAPAPTAPPAPAIERDVYAISTENDASLRVAEAVLDRGGNAVDAAVAGVLVAGVAQPSSTGLGGDGFAVVWEADKKTAFTVDFRATAPKGLRRKDHLSHTPPKKKRGVMVGVPGVVAGLYAMHERAGKMPWADLARLAADTAEKGFVVSPYFGEALAWLTHEKDIDPSFSVGTPSAAPDGSASTTSVPAGATMQNAPLAATLRALAEGGPKAFYAGDLARDVVDTARAAGSALTLADMASYRAIIRDPESVDWEGFRVIGAPPPSGGGIGLAEMLGLFSKKDVLGLGLDSATYVHLLAEGLRATLADRQLVIGDPAFTKMDLPALLEPSRLSAKRAAFRPDSTTMPKLKSISEGGTYHLAIIDEAGSAVSITTTLTDLFGAKLSTRGGFPLNDALVDFAMDDYGQRPTNRGPNFPRGGARPTSSLTPTIVMKDGSVVLALGASGGLRAPSAVLQVLLARLAFERPLDDSVSRPRFFVPSSGALLLDAGLAKLEDDLRVRGEIVDARRPDFGAVSAVEQRVEGGERKLDAAADPRKHGVRIVRRVEVRPAAQPVPTTR